MLRPSPHSQRFCPIGLEWNSDYIFLEILQVILLPKVDEKYWYV